MIKDRYYCAGLGAPKHRAMRGMRCQVCVRAGLLELSGTVDTVSLSWHASEKCYLADTGCGEGSPILRRGWLGPGFEA